MSCCCFCCCCGSCCSSCCCSCGSCNCGSCYCSECVGNAGCNTELCSCCLTGTTCCSPVCTPTPGSGTDICSNTSTSCENIDISSCLPYAGQDENGNEIYQNPDGSLTYSDGSPATRADIAYNCGACRCTPCSPHTCGASDPAPKGSKGGGCGGGGPKGGGSGGGSASGSGTKPRCQGTSLPTKISKALGNFGSTIGNLLSGGKTLKPGAIATNGSKPGVITGQSVTQNPLGLSSNTYLLVIIIVGALLLILAFGHKPTAD